jgi:hypothetical protein
MAVGRRFPVHRPMQQVTLQVIIRTVFGIGEGPRFAELAHVLTRTLDAGAWPALLFPFMQRDLGRFSPWGRFLHYAGRASYILRSEIRAGREQGTAGRTDVRAMMLDARDEAGRTMSEDEIHDELITLLSAGHETTATALAWALRWILADGGLVRKLRDEMATAGDDPQRIAKLELLDATVKESLRLQPVIPLVARVLQRPTRLGALDLPAGASVRRRYLVHHRAPYPDRTAASGALPRVQAITLGMAAVRGGPAQMHRRRVRHLRDEDGARSDATARRCPPRDGPHHADPARDHDHAVRGDAHRGHRATIARSVHEGSLGAASIQRNGPIFGGGGGGNNLRRKSSALRASRTNLALVMRPATAHCPAGMSQKISASTRRCATATAIDAAPPRTTPPSQTPMKSRAGAGSRTVMTTREPASVGRTAPDTTRAASRAERRARCHTRISRFASTGDQAVSRTKRRQGRSKPTSTP